MEPKIDAQIQILYDRWLDDHTLQDYITREYKDQSIKG